MEYSLDKKNKEFSKMNILIFKFPRSLQYDKG